MLKDLTQFRKWCITLASDIAGNELPEIENYTADDNISPVIKLALDTLITGICNKGQQINEIFYYFFHIDCLLSNSPFIWQEL
jgi:hypothetical protein